MNAVKNKEILTDDKMRTLFVANFSDVLYFNFDNGRWNKRKYQGVKIADQFLDTNNAKEMKRTLDPYLNKNGYELVAVAARGAIDEGTPPNDFSRDIIGSIVIRDLYSGKIIPSPTSWLFVTRVADKVALASCVASVFMYRATYEEAFRNRVLFRALQSR